MLKKKLKIYKNNTGFLVPISFKKDIPFIISPIANLFYKFHTL